MIDHPDWPTEARLICSADEIDAAMDAQAARLTTALKGDERITLMALMNGGMVPAMALAKRMQLPMRFDYIHATRYREKRQGSELHWVHRPQAIEGTVVLVDDIFDEGHTMAEVKRYLLEQGAQKVMTVVAVIKTHERGLARDWVDDAALSVPDEYVFGFGMDLDGLWRQLDSIWSIT